MSRREIFGGGFLRQVRERIDAETAPAPPPDPVDWGPGPLRAEAERTHEAVAAVAAAVAVRPGETVLVPEGGALAAALREQGAAVIDHPGTGRRMIVQDGAVSAIASCFGLVHAGPLSDVKAEILRVLRPGGRLVLATFSSAGATGPKLRAARRGGSRPDRWGTYDGLVLALDRFMGFEAHDRQAGWVDDDSPLPVCWSLVVATDRG